MRYTGRIFATGLLPVDYELSGVRISGFAAKPLAARPNRTMQLFFLNGRLVKSRTAMAALEEAYRNTIMVGKFPACVLHLHVPNETVDVNVHPAKIEVRFANEKRIFDAVYYAAKNTLQQKRSAPTCGAKKTGRPCGSSAAACAGADHDPQKRIILGA